jgi:hypothetical protein
LTGASLVDAVVTVVAGEAIDGDVVIVDDALAGVADCGALVLSLIDVIGAGIASLALAVGATITGVEITAELGAAISAGSGDLGVSVFNDGVAGVVVVLTAAGAGAAVGAVNSAGAGVGAGTVDGAVTLGVASAGAVL